MINGKRVVSWVPFGRKDTVSILLEYLQRDHDLGIIDELWLCMNTDPQGQEADQAWAILTEHKRDWVKIKRRPEGVKVHARKQRNTGYFYRYMTDPDTMYVRFDDDVVYVHDDAVARICYHNMHSPAVASFPIIINNAVSSYYLSKDGKLPFAKDYDPVTLSAFDNTGWSNGFFAIDMHEWFLDKISNGTVDELESHMDYELPLGQQFSVSCFASKGSMYASLEPPGVLAPDDYLEEESWHTQLMPRKLGIRNQIVGNAFVAHWSFYTQHPWLQDRGDILERYRALAKELV